MTFIEAIKAAAKQASNFETIKWFLFGITITITTTIGIVLVAIAGSAHPLLGLICTPIIIVSLIFFNSFCDKIRVNWSLENEDE